MPPVTSPPLAAMPPLQARGGGAGVPARHLRFRFDAATIDALLQIAWWDWPLPKIEEALPLLMSSDLKAFLERYGSGHAHGASA